MPTEKRVCLLVGPGVNWIGLPFGKDAYDRLLAHKVRWRCSIAGRAEEIDGEGAPTVAKLCGRLAVIMVFVWEVRVSTLCLSH